MAGEPRTFVDTNVLLYAYDASETAKQPVARATLDSLWADRTGAISSQVLQEFYNAATRKLNPPVSRADAREIIDLYTAWPVVLLEPALTLAATRIEEEHQLSFWDALVVEAARVAGAQRLLTEDMQHGRVIEGVRIENPFATTDQPLRQPASADIEGEQEVPGNLASQAGSAGTERRTWRREDLYVLSKYLHPIERPEEKSPATVRPLRFRRHRLAIDAMRRENREAHRASL
jgi:predicted nucleic acid-binding protein